MSKTERLRPKKIRTATSEYGAVVTRVVQSFDLDDPADVARLRTEFDAASGNGWLDAYEAAARRYLEHKGHDPSLYMRLAFGGAEPLSRVEFAAKILNHVNGTRDAIAKNKASNAAWHAAEVERYRWLWTIRDMELSYRVGERQRRAEGIPAPVLRDMQKAANAEWKAQPTAKKIEVARKIAPRFSPWEVGTIRKKISKPKSGKAV